MVKWTYNYSLSNELSEDDIQNYWHVPSPDVSLEVMWDNHFPPRENLETTQIHGLNSNHFPSNKVCSPFSQTSSLKSLRGGSSTKSQVSSDFPSHFAKIPIPTNQFFHNVPNFVFYIHSPNFLNSGPHFWAP